MKTVPKSLHIGVIRGGNSPEYESSLKRGAYILEHLQETHKPIDIFISQDGAWHMNGIERTPERVIKHVDIVFNSLDSYAENALVQSVLSQHGVRLAGTGRYEAGMAGNKIVAKERAKMFGIKTPVYMAVRRSDSLSLKAKEIWSSLPHPMMVKPANIGSKKDFKKVDSFEALLLSLEHVLEKYDTVLVEEFIQGKDASCLVTEDFRGEKLYAFPPAELLSKEEKKEIEVLAKKIHELLGLASYSSSDFVVSPKRGIYFLAVSPVPHITKESKLHQSIEAVGVKVKDFLHHLVDLALNRR